MCLLASTSTCGFRFLDTTSFFQSHPFLVGEIYRHSKGVMLKMMIEPRRGWTRDLLKYATYSTRAGVSPMMLFGGPHGVSVPVHVYGVVILIASGFGLVAQIPYLQHIIRSHHNGTGNTRRVHLIWQLDDIGNVRGSYSISD